MNNKSKYNPQIHHRRSIRLKGYDYSQAGLYFITICCQDRACLFGEIINGKMILNDAGKMIEKWFKTMSTNEYIRGVKNLGWAPFNGKLWQRNYYEHIIRNEKSYKNISKYIKNNPIKWAENKFYKK